MKNTMTKWLVGMLCAVSLLVAPAVMAADDGAAPVPVQTDGWVISLGGVGSTVTTEGGNTSFGADLSIGHTGKLLLPLEAGLRQGFAYDGSDAVFNTKAYADFTLLTVKKVDLFVGGNVGAFYGDTPVEWTIAPEGGLRWWVKDDVSVLARVEAPFDLEGWEYKDTLRYFLGFQVKF